MVARNPGGRSVGAPSGWPGGSSRALGALRWPPWTTDEHEHRQHTQTLELDLTRPNTGSQRPAPHDGLGHQLDRHFTSSVGVSRLSPRSGSRVLGRGRRTVDGKGGDLERVGEADGAAWAVGHPSRAAVHLSISSHSLGVAVQSGAPSGTRACRWTMLCRPSNARQPVRRVGPTQGRSDVRHRSRDRRGPGMV